MKSKFFAVLATTFLALSFTACSDNDNNNPFDHPKRGEFLTKEVVIKKSNRNRDISESWSNISRNTYDKVVSYDYKLEITGDIEQVEKHDYDLAYFTDHNGNEKINTTVVKEYTKSVGGITESYTENIQENVSINSNGYIDRIFSTIQHYANTSGEPTITTSERTFTYNGDFIKASVYRDEEYVITYKYNWNGHLLSNITVLKENKQDGSVEYNTYDYTFNRKELYPYSGTEVMPFVQSGIPQIYASMGYIGKCTPYILSEEEQGGYTKFGGMTSENIKVHNIYDFKGDPSVRIGYNAISNIYNVYSITFSK